MVKTVLASGLRARALKVAGWFSSNILGNRDGQALHDPDSLQSKLDTKGSVLDSILGYPVEDHVVAIHYYRPRGDEKEAWDTIDLVGFLGRPMQLKVNFLCRDSILAAPIVLDLVLFLDLAQRSQQLRGLGIQEWLSFYFKSPITPPGLYPEHDLFIQSMKLKNTLRHLKGEDLITHLGLEYYD
jgi:myo-inositol-1-phosphate synthase